MSDVGDGKYFWGGNFFSWAEMSESSVNSDFHSDSVEWNEVELVIQFIQWYRMVIKWKNAEVHV